MSGDEIDDYLTGPVPEGLELDVKKQVGPPVMPSHLSRAAMGEMLAAELEGPTPEELADAEEVADFGPEPSWFLGAVPYAVRVAARMLSLRAQRSSLTRAHAMREADCRYAMSDLGRHAFRTLSTDALRGPLGDALARVHTIRREAGASARRAESARDIGHRRAGVLDDRIRDLRGEQQPILREAEERGSAAAALDDIAARAASRRAAAEKKLGGLLETVTLLETQGQGGLEPAELADKRRELEEARQELDRARIVETDALQRARQAESVASAKARDASQLRIQIEHIEAERETLTRKANSALRKADPAVAALDDAFAELGERVYRTSAELPDAAAMIADVRRRAEALEETSKQLALVRIAPRTMNKRAFKIGASILGAIVALVLFAIVYEIIR